MNPEDIRRFYAEEIRVVANLRSPELVKALAKVPRENFLGDGPWSYATPDLLTGEINYRETVSNDPIHLYHNVPIAIDPERGLPNGQPSAIGSFIDNLDLKNGASVLHIGCGTGYFSAVMAEIVGAGGKVTAVEIETDLAARASHCFGGRDDEANNRLLTLMMQGKWRAVQSLRRDVHEITDSCCLHGDSICPSALAVTESAENAKRD
jgi:protein-L-isoaspartate O-methyltransferase